MATLIRKRILAGPFKPDDRVLNRSGDITQVQQQRTSSGAANPMAWAGQAARSAGMPGTGLRMDAEYR